VTADNLIDLSGRVAIVTGAGAGLGRAHAIDLAAHGAAVVVNDLGSEMDGSGADRSRAERVVQEIRAAGGHAVANTLSVVGNGEHLVEVALESFGGLHIVVNNAGILRDRSFHKMEQPDFDAVLDVHLRGAFSLASSAFRHMREQRFGRIINTTSTAGLLGNFGQGNYGSAKMGLYGMMRVLALEGASRNVLSNCLAPVAFTRMSAGMSHERQGPFDPANAAAVVTYLASDDCVLNGEVLSAGGGRVARFFLAVTPGWASGALRAEDVRDHVEQITDEGGYMVFDDARAEVDWVGEQIPFPESGVKLTGRAERDGSKEATKP
jgi:NAD(P)-dependent dehydrogenase (short-subunit alcohol dehydrogenase family)